MYKKTLIFDFFGTLVGTTSPENEAIAYFSKDRSIHPQVQRAFCGANLNSSLSFDEFVKNYPSKNVGWNNYFVACCVSLGIGCTEENKNKIYEIIREQLAEKAKNISEERDNVLKELKKKYRLVIASNAYPPTKQFILENTGLEEFFSEKDIFVSYERGLIKSDSTFYTSILEELGSSSKNVIMIGDSITSDILPAMNVGIEGILCNFSTDKNNIDGGKSSFEKPNNHVTINNFSQLPKTIEKIFSIK